MYEMKALTSPSGTAAGVLADKNSRSLRIQQLQLLDCRSGSWAKLSKDVVDIPYQTGVSIQNNITKINK